MEKKLCPFCGTEYNQGLSKCPSCGKSETATQILEQTEMPEQKRQHSQLGWGIACGILGVAVLAGLVIFLVTMGYLGKQESTPTPAISQTEQPAQTQLPQEPEVPQEAEIPEEPDLSCVALSLSQTAIILDEAGGSIFLTATPTPLDCPEEIVFTSADEAVATVTQNGMITAIAPGQTDITVTCGTVTEICTIVCEFETEPVQPEETDQPETEPEPVPEPSLSSEDFTLFRPGEETTLTVKNAPEGAVITYTSSNSSVATVTANGRVTAVGSGTANITVTVDGKTLTCIARCKLDDTTENNGTGDTGATGGTYTISTNDVTMFRVGETFTLQLTDENGQTVSPTWSSSDASVCTVDAGGRVSATGHGTATVSTVYGGMTYSCIVRCNF